jgi:redox-sensitive bicupin YhaK (pirin superfamily)
MADSILNTFKLTFPWKTQDPFLFCAFHNDHYPKGNGNMGPVEDISDRNIGQDFDPDKAWRMYHGHVIPGFPAHPHRGFETITLAEKGFCDHSDSLGAAGRFGEGDVQWMTAGRGVQHSEMFPLLNDESDNPLELFQIWLNLPAEKKMTDPYFKMLWHEDVPIIQENGVRIKMISGSINETSALTPNPDSWAADPKNEVLIWLISMEPKAEFSLPPSKQKVNRSIYFFEGDLLYLDNTSLPFNSGAELKSTTSMVFKNGEASSRILLLQGKPINEPVVQHGPFVMNSADEIRLAMKEYGLTQFGGWPWPRPDHAHEKSLGRFAKYPNGELVEK